MDVLTTGSFTKALWPGVRKFFEMHWEDWETEWPKLFNDLSSSKAYEEDVGESGLGLAHRKAETENIEYDSSRQEFINRYQHFVWALGIIISKEAYSDDQYGVMAQKKTYALARSMRITKEILGANIFNRGFDPNYTMGNDSDGEPLFSANHSLGSFGGTQSNVLATPADLSETSLEAAMIQVNGFTDNRGLPIAAQPKALAIPRQYQFQASRILDSEYRQGTSLNDVNAIRQNNYLPDGFFVNHYFTDPDAWFLKTTIGDSTNHFSRWGMEFGSDNSFDSLNAKYRAVERYSFGWSQYRGWLASSGLT